MNTKDDTRDPATKAVDKLVEMKLLDPFQRYNIGQVIREAYAAAGVLIPVDDHHSNPVHELAVHRNDCGVFQEFHHKHGLGALGPSSCLVCGKSMAEQPVGIQHQELPDICVCSTCKRLATLPEGVPFGHVHLNRLSWMPHDRWVKMCKMEQDWYPIPIGRFTGDSNGK